jgi:hypothetical protein
MLVFHFRRTNPKREMTPNQIYPVTPQILTDKEQALGIILRGSCFLFLLLVSKLPLIGFQKSKSPNPLNHLQLCSFDQATVAQCLMQEKVIHYLVL